MWWITELAVCRVWRIGSCTLQLALKIWSMCKDWGTWLQDTGSPWICLFKDWPGCCFRRCETKGDRILRHSTVLSGSSESVPEVTWSHTLWFPLMPEAMPVCLATDRTGLVPSPHHCMCLVYGDAELSFIAEHETVPPVGYRTPWNIFDFTLVLLAVQCFPHCSWWRAPRPVNSTKRPALT